MDELVQYLGAGHAPGRDAASGLMAEAVSRSLRHLSRADLRAMAVYLHSLPPKPGTPGSEVALNPPAVRTSMPYAPPTGEARGNAEGLRLFEGSCASCHGWNGEGVQTRYGSLRGAQTMNDPGATNLVQVILRGSEIQTREGHLAMPAFRHTFTDAEVAAVAKYVLQHLGNRRPTVTPDRVATARVASE